MEKIKNILTGIFRLFSKLAINSTIDIIEKKINEIDADDLENFKKKVGIILDSKRK